MQTGIGDVICTRSRELSVAVAEAPRTDGVGSAATSYGKNGYLARQAQRVEFILWIPANSLESAVPALPAIVNKFVD